MKGDEPDLMMLLGVVEKAGWDEARITVGDTTIVISDDHDADVGPVSSPGPAPGLPVPSGNDSGAAAPVSGDGRAPTSDAATAATAKESTEVVGTEGLDGVTVRSTTVGIFWRAPSPQSPPFVEVGDFVDEDTTLCIVEVMKLMTRLSAGVAGEVVAIHQTNGEMVEYGSPLVTIRPT